MHNAHIKDFFVGAGEPLACFLGPCAIESEALALESAEKIAKATEDLHCNIIFKSSFDKANRTSASSKRGVGMDEGLRILAKVKAEFGFPIVTDIHLPDQAVVVAEVADVLQIPAFLCRQTDLLIAAAKTGRCIKVKKGQFIAPWSMQGAVEKIESTGNCNILLTERGTTFGYGQLINDMRAICLMQDLGYPVCFDATHSVQTPGGATTGGERRFVSLLARAAIASGSNALFLECHPRPEEALSDKECQMPLSALRALVEECIELHALIQRGRICSQTLSDS